MAKVTETHPKTVALVDEIRKGAYDAELDAILWAVTVAAHERRKVLDAKEAK